MNWRLLIFLCGLFFVLSGQGHAAAAASSGAVNFFETEEYKKWTRLKLGVDKHTAPFDLPSFFITITETRLLVNDVQKLLASLKPKTLVGGNPKMGDGILSLVAGYKAREPKDCRVTKDRFGRIKEVYGPEMFSVPSKMDIFPTRHFITKEGTTITIKNVSREHIYRTVVDIVTRLANALRGR